MWLMLFVVLGVAIVAVEAFAVYFCLFLLSMPGDQPALAAIAILIAWLLLHVWMARRLNDLWSKED